MTRIALIGDIGGHADLFKRLILQIGGNPTTGFLPSDLAVIQVGDLVRLNPQRGPDSDACVEIADFMMRRNAGRWIQLWGNHDLALIGGACHPTWERRGSVSRATQKTLWRWWEEKRATLAVALRACDGEDFLVTHAGLTLGQWQMTDHPDAFGTASILNDTVGERNPASIAHPGLLVGGSVDMRADVLWAESVREVYAPWQAYAANGHAIPFSQIHGHSSPFDWDADEMSPHASLTLRSSCIVDRMARRTTTLLGTTRSTRSAVAIGIDWVLRDTVVEHPWDVFSCEADQVSVYEIDDPLHPGLLVPFVQ